MIYAAQQLIAQQFTTAAINAQIATVNTALSTSATNVASVMNGLLQAPKDADDYPCLAYFVGQDGAKWVLREFGKRDTFVPVRLLYVSRHETLASGALDIEVALEAMQVVTETLPALQWGTTRRYSVDVQEPVVELVTYKVSEDVIRHGGELRFVLFMRTEG